MNIQLNTSGIDMRYWLDMFQFVVGIFGVVIPIVIIIKEHYSKKLVKRARQVWAFYCVEEAAIDHICALEGNKRTSKEVKIALRDEAEKKCGVRANIDGIPKILNTAKLEE